MMNKKAQQITIFVGIMMFITIFVVAAASLKPMKQIATDARSESTGLNCTDPDNTVFNQGSCIITDLTPFFFFGMALAGSAIYFKFKKKQ